MKKAIITLLQFLVLTTTQAQTLTMARGADVSWCTEMEADGKKFYNTSGTETDLFALLKEMGMTAIRLRVWVNPAQYGYGAWCDKADVLAKARRAHAQGMDLMIDFHYSDFFADPENQRIPSDWAGYSQKQLTEAITTHTTDVLQTLKNEGIEPKWVQVGNETNSGMLKPTGAIDWDKSGSARFTAYAALSNAGYDAVKAVLPSALVIVHLGGTENARWFFPDFKSAGGKFDMIGLSHYPTEAEWNSTAATATHSNVSAARYVKEAATTFGVPVMICETGFDVSKPVLAKEVMADLFSRMTDSGHCAGIFYWEPEVDGQWKPTYYSTMNWGAYGMGAFTTGGRPTVALDPFSGKDNGGSTYPSALQVYDDQGKNVLTTLRPATVGDAVYNGQLNATTPWLNFYVVDEETNTWYGSDPADKTRLSAADDKWKCWIDSEQTGIYDLQVNLATLAWTHTLSDGSGVSPVVYNNPNSKTPAYDLQGRQASTRTHLFIQNGKIRTK